MLNDELYEAMFGLTNNRPAKRSKFDTFAVVVGVAALLALASVLPGCATLRGAARSTCIDRQVVQLLVCEWREAEAAIYIERGGGGDNEIIEFLLQARAKRAEGKCPKAAQAAR